MSHSVITAPTGSACAATARKPCTIAKMRASVSFSRSSMAGLRPLSRPNAMSLSLASRICGRRASTVSAAASRAAVLAAAGAKASSAAASRAFSPRPCISVAMSMPSIFPSYNAMSSRWISAARPG